MGDSLDDAGSEFYSTEPKWPSICGIHRVFVPECDLCMWDGPDACPTCGSDEKAVRRSRNLSAAMRCHDTWHSEAARSGRSSE